MVAECWIDIFEDSIYANNKTMARMWDRIKSRFSSVKPKWAYKWNKKQLLKYWDRLRVHTNNFIDIYTKLKYGRGNFESMEDVLQ